MRPRYIVVVRAIAGVASAVAAALLLRLSGRDVAVSPSHFLAFAPSRRPGPSARVRIAVAIMIAVTVAVSISIAGTVAVPIFIPALVPGVVAVTVPIMVAILIAIVIPV